MFRFVFGNNSCAVFLVVEPREGVLWVVLCFFAFNQLPGFAQGLRRPYVLLF